MRRHFLQYKYLLLIKLLIIFTVDVSFALSKNATLIKDREDQLLSEDLKLSGNAHWQGLLQFPVRSLIMNHVLWQNSKRDFFKNDQCQYFWKQMQELESDARFSAQRAFDFMIYKKDNLMSTYYSIRLFLNAYFLRRMTQIFANNYEGGGDLDKNPLPCITKNRDEIFRMMQERDAEIYLNLQESLGDHLINPLAINFDDLEKMKDTLASRRQAVDVSLTLASAYLGYASSVKISTSLIHLIKQPFFRGVVANLAVGVPFATYVFLNSDSEPDVDFSMRTNDPQSFWDRTMARIYLSLNESLGGDAVAAFRELQLARKSKIAN